MLTNPLMLIALAAIAIPIAVHLFNFRRYRKIYFSNVDHLKELHQQTRRQSELRRWLILVARILTIICIVLAFAQPVIPGSGKQLKPGGTAVSIYLDNSFSMDNTNSDGSLLEMGRTKVREIVEAYEMDDQFQLITNNTDGSQFRWLSKEELLDELDRVEIGPCTLPICSVSEKVYDFLNRSNASNKHSYIIGDFQKTTSDLSCWKSDTSIQTTFIVLSGNSIANLYIDSVGLNAPVYYQGNTLEATVRLKNTGSEPLEQVQLKLFANDAPRSIASVDIPADGHADAVLKMAVDQPGIIQCRVEIADYPITFDDKFFFSINVNNSISVSVIGEDNDYLDRLFSGDSAIAYSKMTERDINYETLNHNSFIILNELHSISSGMAQTLYSWVEEGGTLMVIPNESVDQSYNTALTLWKAPLIGGKSNSKKTVTSLDYENRLFRGVFSNKKDDVELPTAQSPYMLTLGSNSNRSSVMKMADGSDYLTETKNGNGFIYLLASPLREPHTDWTKQALFVPALFNMALFSKPMGDAYHILGQDKLIRTSNHYELPHIKSSTIDILPEVRQISGRTCMLLRDQISASGNYTIEEKETKEGISFNYSRLESDMSTYSQDEIEKFISDYGMKECSVIPNAQKSLEKYIRQQRDDKPLWRWFVVGALLFMMIEITLLRINRKKKSDAES